MKKVSKTIATRLTAFRENWRKLSQGTVWISATIATFLSVPPTNNLFAAGKTQAAFAGFLVAVLAGLIVVAGQRWNSPQHTLYWGMCSGVCLALSLTGFLVYAYSVGRLTTVCDDRRIVVGAELTPMALQAVKHDPGITIEQLIFDADCRFDLVWSRSSVLHNAMYLLAAYLLAVISLTLCLLSLLHAFSCSGPDKRPRPRAGYRRARTVS